MSGVYATRVRDGSLLEIGLGLTSWIARFDALLARHVPEAASGSNEVTGDLALVVLGLVALRRRLDFATLAVPPDRGEPEPNTPAVGLLR